MQEFFEATRQFRVQKVIHCTNLPTGTMILTLASTMLFLIPHATKLGEQLSNTTYKQNVSKNLIANAQVM